MAWLESNRGRLLIGFQYRGERCREYLGLDDNSRQSAHRSSNLEGDRGRTGERKVRLRRTISREPETCAFGSNAAADAQHHSQRRKASRCRRLASSPNRGSKSDERCSRLATAYDYDRLIKALLLPVAARAETDRRDQRRRHQSFSRRTDEARRDSNGQQIGPRRINMMIARLRTIFSIAKRRKLIAEDPMLFVKNLREPKGEVDPFTLEEAERIIDTATGQDRAIVAVLIFCGLRPNEAFALRWQDVDFDREQLKIRRSIHRFARNRPSEEQHRASARWTCSPWLLTSCRSSARARSFAASSCSSTKIGGPIDLTNFRDRNWKRILVKASLRRRTIYQCRHTFAALQLSRGENPQYVAHQMGHTNLEMIIRHYARWSRKPERVGTLAHQLSAKFPSKKPEY